MQALYDRSAMRIAAAQSNSKDETVLFFSANRQSKCLPAFGTALGLAHFSRYRKKERVDLRFFTLINPALYSFLGKVASYQKKIPRIHRKLKIALKERIRIATNITSNHTRSVQLLSSKFQPPTYLQPESQHLPRISSSSLRLPTLRNHH